MRGTDGGYRIYPVFTAHRATGSRCESRQETVAKGELIAAAAEGLSANIHSSVDGVIEEITDKGARITCRKE